MDRPLALAKSFNCWLSSSPASCPFWCFFAFGLLSTSPRIYSNAAKHCGTWWLLVSIRTHRPWSWKHVVLVIHEVPFEDRTASRLEPVTAGQQGWVHLEPTAHEGASLLLSLKQQSDDRCDSDDSGQTTGPTLLLMPCQDAPLVEKLQLRRGQVIAEENSRSFC